MSEKKKIGELPACPVETTLMLIGDKREGADSARPDARHQAVWRAEKIDR